MNGWLGCVGIFGDRPTHGGAVGICPPSLRRWVREVCIRYDCSLTFDYYDLQVQVAKDRPLGRVHECTRVGCTVPWPQCQALEGRSLDRNSPQVALKAGVKLDPNGHQGLPTTAGDRDSERQAVGESREMRRLHCLSIHLPRRSEKL